MESKNVNGLGTDAAPAPDLVRVRAAAAAVIQEIILRLELYDLRRAVSLGEKLLQDSIATLVMQRDDTFHQDLQKLVERAVNYARIRARPVALIEFRAARRMLLSLNQARNAPAPNGENGAPEPFNDPRRETRFTVNLPAFLRVAGSPYQITLMDVSKSGMRVRCAQRFPVGTQVEVRIADATVHGEVRYLRQTAPDQFNLGISVGASDVDLLSLVSKQNHS